MKLSTKSLDHLGLVAGIFDELGISEVIDEAIPKTRDCKLQHSAIIKGLIINGLGFTERPTLKWVFQTFRNINGAIFELQESIHREIININDEQMKVMKLFGSGCEKYYI